MTRLKLLDELSCVMVSEDPSETRRLAEFLLDDGASAKSLLEAMLKVMRVVDAKYKRKEYFLIDVTVASSAMKEALSSFISI